MAKTGSGFFITDSEFGNNEIKKARPKSGYPMVGDIKPQRTRLATARNAKSLYALGGLDNSSGPLL